MDTTPSALLRRIFDEAAERPASQRAEFVRKQCGGDAAMEQDVLSLLSALEHRSAPLDADPATWLVGPSQKVPPSTMSPPGGRSPLDATTADLRGTLIGDFRLGALIGRGAIGAVYQAEQLSLKRPVAVKLLQTWSASREARRRFIEESAILARLRHPGIAQVIAAGTRELDLSGSDRSLAAGLFTDFHSVPWIAMELVDDAKTIVDYCRVRSLSPMDILILFAHACDAVHHGHQQGVIHRDLKPANILVNARGEVKVIDFGIAKAIGSGRNSDIQQTQQGSVFGTLRYMSPEQLGAAGASVDTRSDIYALGVVLYEALTGTLPYALDEASFASAVKTVCDTAPADPRALSPTLTADAAVVLQKALCKAPLKRYQSAAELAADLRRVIAREPVLARRASGLYRLRMFARRRPATTALMIATALAITVGVVGLGIGLSRERVARGEAEHIAWLANLAAADSSLRLGDGGSAMRRLQAVPETRRGWEWHFLHQLADTSANMWQITDLGDGAFLSHTGRFSYCSHAKGPDRHADIIDNTTRQVIATVEEGLPSGTVVWNPDESLIALSQLHAVLLLNAKTGAEIRRWPRTQAAFPLGAEFSPDGSLLAVGLSEFGGVVVYDVRSGKEVFSKPSEGWVYHPAFSPDGKELAWSDVKSVETVETATWTPRRSVATARITSVEPGNLSYSPDGKLLAVVCGLVVQVIDAESWTVRATLRGHAQRVHSLSFDESGTRLVTTSIDRTVRVWNAISGEQIVTLLGHESPTMHARFISGAAPGQPSVISVDNASRVRTWNLDANGPIFTASADRSSIFISQLDFLEETSTLRAIGATSLISVNVQTRPTLVSESRFDARFLGVIPGSQAVIRNVDNRALSLLSLVDGHEKWSSQTVPVYRFVASPDGKLLAAYRYGDQLSILRVTDGGEVAKLPLEPTGFCRVAFAPDGTTLATLADSGTLGLWDTSNGNLKERIEGAGDGAAGLCWSNDGSLLAYAHLRQGVTVLDRRTRKPVTRIDSVGDNVWSIAISPDKSRIAVGSQDRITHLYELPSGDEVLQIRDHTGTVMSIAWSPDGRLLATGGYDSRVFVYDSGTRQESSTVREGRHKQSPLR